MSSTQDKARQVAEETKDHAKKKLDSARREVDKISKDDDEKKRLAIVGASASLITAALGGIIFWVWKEFQEGGRFRKDKKSF